MTAIFDCVYGINEGLKLETERLLKDDMFEDFLRKKESDFFEYNR